MEKTDLGGALKLLPDWYVRTARDLPWRRDREPYHVWISEIMLQQTRVEAVKAYYTRFLKAFPSVSDLAACEEEALLKLWEGLGYYSRARNLRKSAQVIVSDYGGAFPDSYEALLSLPGIGPYTAGAIASIAFRLPAAAVDGNVLRVLSRLRDDERDIADAGVKKKITEQITDVLNADSSLDPGIVNQALMELGAVICVPNGAPHCEACPWAPLCRSRRNGTIAQRPVKAAAKARRIERRTILLITDGERLLLKKRPGRGLLAGMYEPVNLSGWSEKDAVVRIVREMGLSPLRVTDAPGARHVFTHIEWEMRGYQVRVEEVPQGADGDAWKPSGAAEGGIFADLAMIRTRYAVPSAFRVYMEWMQERGIMSGSL